MTVATHQQLREEVYTKYVCRKCGKAMKSRGTTAVVRYYKCDCGETKTTPRVWKPLP